MTKKQVEKLKNFFEEKDFNVYLTKQNNTQCAEIETWTDGGVNMVISLSPFTAEEFEKRVNDFDVDEEIEVHRQGKDYRNAFTIRESLTDFEDFHKRLQSVSDELKAYNLQPTT